MGLDGCGALIPRTKHDISILKHDAMGKNKNKRCKICTKHEHCTKECPYMCEEFQKGDECKYYCMVDLCTKLHKVIKKFHKASSSRKMERAFEKLDAFERDLESAFEYHEDREGRRSKSCSSMKRVAKLQSACEALHEKYEDKFEDDSSDSDDEWCVPSCMQVIEAKEVDEGKSQESQQNPIKTPSPTVELAHGASKNEESFTKMMDVMCMSQIFCFALQVSNKPHEGSHVEKDDGDDNMHVSLQDVYYHDVDKQYLYVDAKNGDVFYVNDNEQCDDDKAHFNALFPYISHNLMASLLYEGVCVPSHTIFISWKHDGVMLSLIHAKMMQVKYDGACVLIHAILLDDNNNFM